jgi:hypothetical protein
MDGLWSGVMVSLLSMTLVARLLLGAMVGANIGATLTGIVPAIWSAGNEHRDKASAPTENKMGSVKGNTGIVTQGQKGDNTNTR